jgi:manganese transport system ATP-binding protein
MRSWPPADRRRPAPSRGGEAANEVAGDHVVDVRDITVRYSQVVALEDASLALGSSRVCALIGMNGSGKSTLFKAIMGLVRPRTGTVRLFGADPAVSRQNGIVAYVPQAENVDWDFPLRVRDVVAMGRYGRMSALRTLRREDRAAIDDALQQVELADLAERQIGELSGGQRKRAFVARGLAQNAQLLLLDEPFSGVDKRSEATISRILRQRADAGCTVLIATHDLHAVPDLADEAVLLHKRILLHSTPHEVLRPENLALAFHGGEVSG